MTKKTTSLIACGAVPLGTVGLLLNKSHVAVGNVSATTSRIVVTISVILIISGVVALSASLLKNIKQSRHI